MNDTYMSPLETDLCDALDRQQRHLDHWRRQAYRMTAYALFGVALAAWAVWPELSAVGGRFIELMANPFHGHTTERLAATGAALALPVGLTAVILGKKQ